MTHRALAGLLVLALVGPAAADDSDVIPGHAIDRRVTGGITGVAMAAGLVSQLIPLRSTDLWSSELASYDEGERGRYSSRAAHISDAMLGLSLAAPALYLVGSTIDDADGDKLLLYGQSIAINTMLAGVVKRLVQRPRPYTYSKDPLVRRYAAEEGDDAYLSFYSGHAAISFGAAVTGAYLLGASGTNKTATTFAWGGGMMVAAATATLRVRAGKHFYSDVLVGSLVGIAVGYAVPALHADGKPYIPSGGELAAGAAGIVGGVLLSSLIPLEKHPSEVADRKSGLVKNLQLSPMAVDGGGFGFAIAGGL